MENAPGHLELHEMLERSPLSPGGRTSRTAAGDAWDSSSLAGRSPR
jgi:hypothetical protein